MGWGFIIHEVSRLPQRRTIVGRTPLDEGNLYLTTHNTHNRQTSMPVVGFEPTISAAEWPQTHALDRAATWTDSLRFEAHKMHVIISPQCCGRAGVPVLVG